MTSRDPSHRTDFTVDICIRQPHTDPMTTNLRDLALKPRAVALLVALRREPLNDGQLQYAIGDATTAETRELTSDMRDDGLIANTPDDVRWHLTHDGLGWLQSQGLDASESAKQALYAATDAQAINSHCGVSGCPGGSLHAHDPADWSSDAKAVR